MDGLKARLSFDAVAYDYDDDYLTIDTDTHIININNLSRLFGVQYDGNSKLIKFRISNKLSDIQKMQDSIVYINWIDSKGVKGQSIAIDKTISNDICEFAWKVPFDALKNSRVLHFAMSAVITENSSSVINQKWSTQIASVIIPDGIYIKSYTPSREEEDRIAQIYNELSNMINKQNDNLQSQVNSLKGDYLPIDKPLNILNKYQFKDGYYDPIQKKVILLSDYKHIEIQAYKGDVFLYGGYCAYGGRLYAEVFSDTKVTYYPTEVTGDFKSAKIVINEPCVLYLNTQTSKLSETTLYKMSAYTNIDIRDNESFNIVDYNSLTNNLLSSMYDNYLHYVCENNDFKSSTYIVKCKKSDVIRTKYQYFTIVSFDEDLKTIDSTTLGANESFTITNEKTKYIGFYFDAANDNGEHIITINHDIPDYYVPYGVKQLDSEAQMRRKLKWCAIGDSITDSATLVTDSHGNKNYVNFVTNVLLLDSTNLGVGGTGYIANNSGASKTFVQRIDDIPIDTELITVFGSFNDVYQGFELGTINDDKTTNTLYGKLKEFYESLFAKRPNAIVGLITPTPWEMCCRYNTSSDKHEKTIQYITALLDVAKLYSIPVLNMFDESDMRPYDSVFKQAYYRDNDDNVHPNQKGHEKYISPKVVDFIRKITMYN